MGSIGLSCVGLYELYKNPDRFFPILLEYGISIFEAAHMRSFDMHYKNRIYSVHAPKDLLDSDEYLLMSYLMALRNEIKNSSCKLLVFHPPKQAHSINPDLFGIFPENITIGIENTSSTVFECVERLSFCCNSGIVLDFDHAHRVGNPVSEYFKHKVVHTHIRGNTVKGMYNRIKENKTYVHSLVNHLKDFGYEGVFMLEYPYAYMADIIEDRQILEEILQGQIRSASKSQ